MRAIDELLMISPGSGMGELDAKTLEMDADVFAITAVLLQSLSGSRPGKWINPKFDDINGDGASAAANALFAIYLIWRMFDEACDLANVERRSHPPVPMRQAMMFAAASTALTERHGFEASKAQAVLMAAMISAELCYAKTKSRPIDVAAIKLSAPQEGQAYVGRLIGNLEVLKPRLEVLLRG
jgi:hypothetical protein